MYIINNIKIFHFGISQSSPRPIFISYLYKPNEQCCSAMKTNRHLRWNLQIVQTGQQIRLFVIQGHSCVWSNSRMEKSDGGNGDHSAHCLPFSIWYITGENTCPIRVEYVNHSLKSTCRLPPIGKGEPSYFKPTCVNRALVFSLKVPIQNSFEMKFW